jgi:hypothetical protein
MFAKATIVVDVDSVHITSLLQAKPLQEYQVGGDKHANLVVHRISAAVAADAGYIEWASQFDEKTEVSRYLTVVTLHS